MKEGFLDLPDMPVVYRSIRQSPARAIIAIVRTTGPQKTIAENISRTLRSAFPSVPLEPAIGFDQWVHDRFPMFLRRMPAVVFPALAVMALLLTSLALYGVVSLSVAQRLQEIGVRVAMGATPRHILDVLLAPVLRLIAVGIVAGLVIAALLARARPEMLFGVSPFDPLTCWAWPCWRHSFPRGEPAKSIPPERCDATNHLLMPVFEGICM